MLEKYLKVSPEVKEALENNKPVVALESTIISHGMPYPKNAETALKCEQIIRESGAIPATIAIIKGVLCVGLSCEEIEYVAKEGKNVIKVSRRDIPVVVANKLDGATTVAATMYIASLAGVKVFATGGIGGVHRGAEVSMDISADLDEATNWLPIQVKYPDNYYLDLRIDASAPLRVSFVDTEMNVLYTVKEADLEVFRPSGQPQ